MKKEALITALFTALILSVPPLLSAHWYISQITIDEFAPVQGLESGGVTKTLPSTPLVAGSSTEPISFSLDPKFKNFDRMTGYLSLFNINPNLIKYDFYLTNLESVKIFYSEVGSTSIESSILPSVLVCGENHITENNPILMGSDLLLNDPSNTDRELIDSVYNQCATNSEVAIQNPFGRSILFAGMQIQQNSGVNILIEPEIFSKLIVYLTFVTIWIGFVTLIIGGFGSLYSLIKKIYRFIGIAR